VTNAELALLTILAERPRHGYDIERVIEERGMREWTTIGFSSIYYLLKKLGQMGLIKGKLEETSQGPARKVYHLTAAGADALREGVLEALSVPTPRHSPLEIGLANLPGIPAAEVLAALKAYRDALVARIRHVEVTWARQRPLPYFVDAMFTYGITMGEAERKWVDDLIEQVEEQHERVRSQWNRTLEGE
jgi:DNA-binding PadR family transcriptional regulator